MTEIDEHKYNKTQLSPDKEFERHIFHRDQFAHYLRWSHVLKEAKIGQKILDLGCGTGNLLEVFYRNRYKPERYLGIDIRKQTVKSNKEKYKKLDFADFIEADVTKETFAAVDNWDFIVSFELLEHIQKNRAEKLLNTIWRLCSSNTVVLLSTPIYDPMVGAANNHIIDGKVNEWEYEELKNKIEEKFKIIDVFGTFASQKDYKIHMNEWQTNMFEHLKKYYDTNLVSNLMAPFFPKYSRNCLWKIQKK